MKKEIEIIIKCLSLFFDIDKKKLYLYLKNYKFSKDKIEVILNYPKNQKVIIKLLKRITKEDLTTNSNDINIIIKINEKNKTLTSIKKINNTTIYTLDIKIGYNISKKDISKYTKRTQNLIKVTLLLMNLTNNQK